MGEGIAENEAVIIVLDDYCNWSQLSYGAMLRQQAMARRKGKLMLLLFLPRGLLGYSGLDYSAH